jgi:hypothetical protein
MAQRCVALLTKRPSKRFRIDIWIAVAIAADSEQN